MFPRNVLTVTYLHFEFFFPLCMPGMRLDLQLHDHGPSGDAF